MKNIQANYSEINFEHICIHKNVKYVFICFRETKKILEDYKFKISKVEQENATLQATTARLETQVNREILINPRECDT